MAYCLVCQRSRENQGPRQNRTYVNVASQGRVIGTTSETLAQYQAREPDAVWFDPENNEYLIEITLDQYEQIIDGTFELFYDNLGNLPYWQQQFDTTGAALSLGSYEDPQDSNTTFTVDQALPDDRFVLRVYDKDPVADGSAVNIGSEEFFEDTVNTTVERFFQLFDKDEQPINRNAANDRLLIDGYYLDLDWGSSDNLSAGVARFFVNREVASESRLTSDTGYRILGPDSVIVYTWTVYTKTIRALKV